MVKSYLALLGFVLIVLSACSSPKEAEGERIVSLNGTITELIYALDYSENLVGVDVTSTYPEAAKELMNLGHTRQLNVEAVLALKPTLVLMTAKDTSISVMQKLKNSGVRIAVVDIEENLDGAYNAAVSLNKILGTSKDLSSLAKEIKANKQALKDVLASDTIKPKVLFIYARGSQMLMVAGKNTFAEYMIELAGGQHPVKEFESFKPLTPEALVQYQPEVILMFDSGLASLKTDEAKNTAVEQLFEVPGMAATPAAQNKRVVTMDGLYLSGFGPRASQAVLELAQKIHVVNN